MTKLPRGTLDDYAIMMHELFESFKRAGFTEFQAFELVKAWVTKGLEGGPSAKPANPGA